MIYQLEIENFYSVRERQFVDLTVGKKVPDEPGRLVRIHDGTDVRAPQVVALFGANASGKSNVLRVIAFLAWFVQFSFAHPAGSGLPYYKFQTQETINKPTVLSVTLSGLENPLTPGDSATCPYVYRLELSPRTGGKDQVLRESLHYRPRGSSRLVRILDRDASGNVMAANWVGFGSELAVLKRILRPDASIIATMGQLNNNLAREFIQSANMIDANISVTKFERQDSITRLLLHFHGDGMAGSSIAVTATLASRLPAPSGSPAKAPPPDRLPGACPAPICGSRTGSCPSRVPSEPA